MIVIEDRPTVYFDVDNTLVLWPDFSPEIFQKHKGILRFSSGVFCVPNVANINALKEHAARGHKIIIWSAGGAAWGAQIIKLLDLEDLVDLVLAKPMWFYDDKPAHEFLPEFNRVYKS